MIFLALSITVKRYKHAYFPTLKLKKRRVRKIFRNFAA
nr:MAG TPA: hypothetical protein [Caudoviricetes sp.]